MSKKRNHLAANAEKLADMFHDLQASRYMEIVQVNAKYVANIKTTLFEQCIGRSSESEGLDSFDSGNSQSCIVYN